MEDSHQVPTTAYVVAMLTNFSVHINNHPLVKFLQHGMGSGHTDDIAQIDHRTYEYPVSQACHFITIKSKYMATSGCKDMIDNRDNSERNSTDMVGFPPKNISNSESNSIEMRGAKSQC